MCLLEGVETRFRVSTFFIALAPQTVAQTLLFASWMHLQEEVETRLRGIIAQTLNKGLLQHKLLKQFAQTFLALWMVEIESCPVLS